VPLVKSDWHICIYITNYQLSSRLLSSFNPLFVGHRSFFCKFLVSIITYDLSVRRTKDDKSRHTFHFKMLGCLLSSRILNFKRGPRHNSIVRIEIFLFFVSACKDDFKLFFRLIDFFVEHRHDGSEFVAWLATIHWEIDAEKLGIFYDFKSRLFTGFGD